MKTAFKFLFLLPVLFHYADSSAQVTVIKFPELQKIMNANNDTTYVINFWATWCNPCVKEIPFFEKLHENHANDKVAIVLLSMDFRRDAHTRVDAIVKKNNIRNRVMLLDETDYNSWIDKVDSSWSGAIPATLVCKGKVKKFYEKEFSSYLELENVVKPLIN